jgi:hypothetical protein
MAEATEVETEVKYVRLTICDRVLPWCFLAKVSSSPLPLPGFRWVGRALLSACAMMPDVLVAYISWAIGGSGCSRGSDSEWWWKDGRERGSRVLQVTGKSTYCLVSRLTSSQVLRSESDLTASQWRGIDKLGKGHGEGQQDALLPISDPKLGYRQ